MTLLELFRLGEKTLRAAGIDDAGFDSLCLFQFVFGFDRQGIYLHGMETADPAKIEQYQALLARRMNGEPLQYLLGEWEFCGIPFSVGEGVLIPREETELLVEFALEKQQSAGMHILDLCSGSGAIAVACALRLNRPDVTAVELSPLAETYLRQNIARNNARVRVVIDNVLLPEHLDELPMQDLILSNPPYIPSRDLPTLQREVRREPVMALDGGEDGLLFYRTIPQQWLQKLRPGGWLAVEIGIGESAAVTEIFRSYGLMDIEVRKDFAGIDRVVLGKKQEK